MFVAKIISLYLYTLFSLLAVDYKNTGLSSLVITKMLDLPIALNFAVEEFVIDFCGIGNSGIANNRFCPLWELCIFSCHCLFE